ncbi:NUDIX hydrolase [Schaalia sp. ZJ405]|uniref:NUDIX hydrolase n=1 Tax=unclassified Schaalia TaxID=2691889 RepID=UPI0013E9DBE2|nr:MULTISPECIES: NUDIX hydrolase [unclassified Schaalia]QPK81338.1 NUDIX hydrolase [Schaalia sp. ZJ405]
MPVRSKDQRPGVPRPPRRRTSVQTVHSHSPHLPISSETSAGGIVVDIRDGIPYAALIARRNRAGRIEWCLPKGHLEGKETPEEAALREVAEETGINGRIIRHLASIDYWFSGSDRRVHKVVHHYLMGFVSGEISVEGDPDHEAEDAAWIPLKSVSQRLAYPNERRIVSIALDLLYRDL